MQESVGLAITVGPEIESLNLRIKVECVCWIINGQAAIPAWLGSAEIYSLLVTARVQCCTLSSSTSTLLAEKPWGFQADEGC